MEIALVTKYFHPHRGGIESNALGISTELASKGHHVRVYTSNDPKTRKREVVSGIEVSRHSVWFTLFNAPFTPGLLPALLRDDYYLIHAHLPDPFNSIFALIASVVRNKPLYVTYHADIIKDRWFHLPFKIAYGFFLSLVLARAERIIATTPNYVNGSQIPKRYRNKIAIAPNFVDQKRFNPDVSGREIRERYGLLGKKIVFFLGRLVPYKGCEYLIEAFRTVKKNDPNAALLIGGRGPLEKELKKKAAGIKDIIFIEIEDAEMPLHYAACDIFVLPSVTRQEAFGIALLEAMACGKPVISTDFSGMPYVVADAGLLVKPRDTEGLAKAIIRLLNDDGTRSVLGAKARKRVEKLFTQSVVAERILSIYQGKKV